MSKRNWIWFGVIAILIVAAAAGGYWYLNRNKISASNSRNPTLTIDELRRTTFTEDPKLTGGGSSSGGSTGQRTYRARGGSRATAAEIAYQRCNESLKIGRLQILVATKDANVAPIAASMQIITDNTQQSTTKGSATAEIIEIGHFHKYSFTAPYEDRTLAGLGLDKSKGYLVVQSAESRKIPMGKYTVYVELKDSSTGELQQLQETVEIKSCEHSTLIIKVDKLKEDSDSTNNKFCIQFYDGTTFSGTYQECIDQMVSKGESREIVPGPCPESATTETGDTAKTDNNSPVGAGAGGGPAYGEGFGDYQGPGAEIKGNANEETPASNGSGATGESAVTGTGNTTAKGGLGQVEAAQANQALEAGLVQGTAQQEANDLLGQAQVKLNEANRISRSDLVKAQKLLQEAKDKLQEAKNLATKYGIDISGQVDSLTKGINSFAVNTSLALGAANGLLGSIGSAIFGAFGNIFK